MRPKSTLRSFLLRAGSCSLLAISSASAQSWSGATDGDWLTTTNWTGGDPAGDPTATTNTDIAVFGVNLNNTIGINMTTTGGVYYLGAIDNTNATNRIIQNTSGTTGILTLNGATVNSVANTIIRNSTNNTLTIRNVTPAAGTLGLALGNAANIIQITSGGGVTISSNISGSGGIDRQGAGSGALTLSGNNNYTGVTTSNRPIAISNANALGSTGSGNHTSFTATGSATTGGQLQVSGNINSPEDITIGGSTESSGFAGAITSSGNNTLSGNITLAGTGAIRIVSSSGTLNLTGNITQTTTTHGLVLQGSGGANRLINVSNAIAINGGGLTIYGAGIVTLSGVSGSGIGSTSIDQGGTLKLGITNALNTTANLTVGASGATTDGFDLASYNQTVNGLSSLAGGTRRVFNSVASTTGTLTVGNGGGTATFNGTIVDNTGTGGTVALVKTGSGIQTLAGANTYTGATTVNGGTLSITGSLNSSTALAVGGGTFSYAGAAAQTVNGLTVNAVGSVVTNTNSGTTNKLNLGAITRNAGGVNFSNATAANNVITTTTTNTNGILGAWATVGADWAANDGSDNIVAYTGYTNVVRLTPGTIADGSATNVRIIEGSGSAGNIGMAASGITTINTLLQSASGGTGAATVDVGAGNTLQTAGLMVASTAGALTIGTAAGSGTVTAASAGGELIALNQSSNTLTVNSVIANHTSASSLTKLGTGTLALSTTNTYTGTTTISQGTLALSGSGSIASSSQIQINSSTTLDVTAVTGSFTLGSAQTVAGTGTILATGKTVVASGTLSPGNSPGTAIQNGGTLQLGVDGDLNWQVYDANGVAGTGYDTVSLINGATLDLTALSVGSEYNINLWSLSAIGSDVNGNAINFNNTLNYAWTLFSTTSAISGFDTSKFTINAGAFNGTSGFSNTLNGTFGVGLADGGTDIVLTYTSAIPEPGAAFIGSLGLLALLRRRR